MLELLKKIFNIFKEEYKKLKKPREMIHDFGYIIGLFGYCASIFVFVPYKCISQILAQSVYQIMSDTYVISLDIIDIMDTLLVRFSRNGNTSLVKLLLKLGFNPNISSSYGESPLKGLTPLMAVIESDNISFDKKKKIINLLLDNGANINKQVCDRYYKKTALTEACRAGHLNIVEFLVEKGAYVNCITNNYTTALVEACRAGHLNIVKFLVEKGAYVNYITNNYTTALTEACRAGHLNIVEFLVEKGAYVNYITNNYTTALTEACGVGHLSIVKFLVEQGANINLVHHKPDRNENALGRACAMGHLDVVKFLVEQGADVNKVAILKDACYSKNFDIVKYLILNGANFTSVDVRYLEYMSHIEAQILFASYSNNESKLKNLINIYRRESRLREQRSIYNVCDNVYDKKESILPLLYILEKHTLPHIRHEISRLEKSTSPEDATNYEKQLLIKCKSIEEQLREFMKDVNGKLSVNIIPALLVYNEHRKDKVSTINSVQ